MTLLEKYLGVDEAGVFCYIENVDPNTSRVYVDFNDLEAFFTDKGRQLSRGARYTANSKVHFDIGFRGDVCAVIDFKGVLYRADICRGQKFFVVSQDVDAKWAVGEAKDAAALLIDALRGMGVRVFRVEGVDIPSQKLKGTGMILLEKYLSFENFGFPFTYNQCVWEMANIFLSVGGYRMDVWPNDRLQFPPHAHVFYASDNPKKENSLAEVKITLNAPTKKSDVVLDKVKQGVSVSDIAGAVCNWANGDANNWAWLKSEWGRMNPENKIG